MIYTIGKQKLDIPEVGPERRVRTPRQVVPWRDMAETCRCLDAICQTLPQNTKQPYTIVDGIARSGFWGALFRNLWPNCQLLMNGETAECLPILKKNFPHDEIVCKDVHKWTPPESDIALLDFDTFTLRGIDKWEDVLLRWAPQSQYFMFVDGACFGWKFGNLKKYGIEKAEDYYYLLEETVSKITGKHITKVSVFCNAAPILMEDRKPKRIEFIPASKLFLSRGGKGYKNDVPTTIKKSLFDL